MPDIFHMHLLLVKQLFFNSPMCPTKVLDPGLWEELTVLGLGLGMGLSLTSSNWPAWDLQVFLPSNRAKL